MFKNLIISIMGSWIIHNMDFWSYDDVSDRILIFLGLAMILFVTIAVVEDAIQSYMRARYIKKWRVNRFKDVVKQNTTQDTRSTRVQECDEIIRTLEDAKRTRR